MIPDLTLRETWAWYRHYGHEWAKSHNEGKAEAYADRETTRERVAKGDKTTPMLPVPPARLVPLPRDGTSDNLRKS